MQLDPYEAEQMLQNNDNLVILDVREPWKYDTLPRVKGARHLYVADVPTQVEALIPDKNTRVMIYCTAGIKSRHAQQVMQELGYTNVHDFGGLETWWGLLDDFLE